MSLCPFEHRHGPLLCPAALAAATVGFLLSVFATILQVFASFYFDKQPIVNARNTSTPSSSFPSQVTATRSTTLSKRFRPPEKLQIDVKRKAPAEVPLEKLVLFSSSPLSADTQDSLPTQPLPLSLPTPVQEIPSIAITPPPTRLSLQSDSSHATDANTLTSIESDAAAVPAALAEGRGRGRSRLRFSKFVHLFDKRARAERRRSLPPISPDSDAPSDGDGGTVPSSPTSAVSPLPASPPTSPTSLKSKKKSPREFMRRVGSCPGLHHSNSIDVIMAEGSEQSPRSSSPTPQSPSYSGSKKKGKEPSAPRPRTQPYAAPYFIPPPDSANFVEPLTKRRNPSRRRTMPPPAPERRMSGLVPVSPVAETS